MIGREVGELLLLLKMIAYVIFNFNLKNYSVVGQLHMEFLRAGANVMQTFTFSASEEKLESKVSSGASWWGK